MSHRPDPTTHHDRSTTVINVPRTTQQSKHRKTCTHCDATPAGCDSNYWLRSSRCCSACSGDHDQAEETS